MNLRFVTPLVIVVVLVVLSTFVGGDSPAMAQTGAPSTGNIVVRDGPILREVVISWDAVPAATHYRIGYVNMESDYPLAKASNTGNWLEAFVYVDVEAQNFTVVGGRAEYTIRRLEQGVRHAFTVRTGNSPHGDYTWPSNPRWKFHVVTGQGTACPTTSPAPTPTSDCLTDGTCLPIRSLGTFSGSGNSAKDVVYLAAGLYRFTGSRSNTDGNFFIDVVEVASGESRSGGIYGRGQSGGQTTLTIYNDDSGFRLQQGNYILEVDTDHDWMVTIEQLAAH